MARIAAPTVRYVTPAASGEAISFDLTGNTGTQPFVVGHAFRLGDIPSGSGVVVTGATAQVTARNAWPDGSLKFAEIAGTASLANGVWSTITLSAGTSSTGTALTTTDLQSALTQAVTVDAGTFGSASWSGSDWASPFSTWTSGHQMSNWVYRKAVGSDAHLVAWLEVRLFASGAVEILPWIENGYVLVSSPSNRSETYTFTMGGTQRFSAAIDLKHHQRTPLLSGSALSHWLGTDPSVIPLHDAAYLQSTELVPTYRVAVSPGSSLVTALPSTYTPLQAGSLVYTNDSMPDAGFQTPIGLLPQHDVLALTTSASAYASVVRNGYSAGRYGIHYRDENTQRAVIPANHVGTTVPDNHGVYHAGTEDGSTYPGGTNTPVVTGGNAPVWDTAHCPSVGFMAYLLSGRWYHMETCQFAAAINYLGRANIAAQRGTAGQGFVHVDPNSVGVRDSAWAWRTLAQALCVTPDSDTTWRNAWKTVAQNNIDDYHAQYVAQSNDPLGFTQAGTTAYDGTLRTTSPWMHDFQTAAWGMSACMGLPLDSGYQTKLEQFVGFTAKSVVIRLGTVASGWSYQNAAVYNCKVSANNSPDWAGGTGPWYTAAEAYAATYSSPPAWLGDTSVNALADENLPGSYPAAVRSFWGNLQPAISYAVRHGVSGALDAYNRMIGTSNWSSFVSAWDEYPGWAVKPASGD